MFEKFINRYVIDGDIRTKTALYIGASSYELTPRAVDNQFIKNAYGMPYIPGSSIKGVMRSFLERILAAGDVNTCTITELCLSDFAKLDKKKSMLERTLGKKLNSISEQEISEYIYSNICPICSIFGGANNSAKLMLRDAGLKNIEQFNGFEIRNGVSIDRETNTAAKGHLYEVEVVPADTVFSFRAIGENLTLDEWRYILIALRAMEEGYLEFGGMTSRGLGAVVLENITIDKVEGKEIFNSLLKNKGTKLTLNEEISRMGDMDV